MKIAVTSTGASLDAAIDKRFGRCSLILMVETEGMRFDVLRNPYADESGGAGGRLAALIAGHGAHTVITGTVGPHAREALDAANIVIVSDCLGTVRSAIDTFMAARSMGR